MYKKCSPITIRAIRINICVSIKVIFRMQRVENFRQRLLSSNKYIFFGYDTIDWPRSRAERLNHNKRYRLPIPFSTTKFFQNSRISRNRWTTFQIIYDLFFLRSPNHDKIICINIKRMKLKLIFFFNAHLVRMD